MCVVEPSNPRFLLSGDAWRAWCLRRHMVSDRRDTQLDCFDAGGHCLLRRARLLVRWFVVLTFSPTALGGRVAKRPFIACIWDYCTQLNLARLIMLLGNAPIVLVLFLNLPSFCPLGMVGL